MRNTPNSLEERCVLTAAKAYLQDISVVDFDLRDPLEKVQQEHLKPAIAYNFSLDEFKDLTNETATNVQDIAVSQAMCVRSTSDV